MDESSSTIVNTDNSTSSKETAINTNPNIEYYNQISPYMEKHIIKSIAQNLRDIIRENIRNNQMKYVKFDLFFINRQHSISIEDFINLIYKSTKMSISTLIMSIIYIDKFCEINKIFDRNRMLSIYKKQIILNIFHLVISNIFSDYISQILGDRLKYMLFHKR